MSSQIVSSCPSIREEIAQEVYRNGDADQTLFWDQFSSLWPPHRWGNLVEQLQEKIEAVPHGRLVWPHLEPYIEEATEIGIDFDSPDEPFGPSDDGRFNLPPRAHKLSGFLSRHDEFYDACNQDLHAEHEEEWQEMLAGIEDGYARLADDEH